MAKVQDGVRDLRPAVDRGLDRIGEVTVVVAKDAKVDAIDVAGESFARDGIIESGERGRRKAAGDGLGEARFVDGAHGKRQPPL